MALDPGALRRRAGRGHRRGGSAGRAGHAGARISGRRFRAARRRYLGRSPQRRRKLPRRARDRAQKRAWRGQHRGSTAGDGSLPGTLRGSPRNPREGGSTMTERQQERETIASERERTGLSTADMAAAAERREPAQSVEQADSLVAELMKHLAEIFADERDRLEHQWSRGDDVSTEDLRIALRRYRSFFDRLLSM